MEQKKILIVDDDADFVEAIKIVLGTKYKVIVAYNGEEGRQKLKEENPDLVILDMMMRIKGEGFIFSREMRKNHQFSHIPILMLTGIRKKMGFFPIEDDPRHPKFLPVDDFIEKPVQPEELLGRVEKLLMLPKEKINVERKKSIL